MSNKSIHVKVVTHYPTDDLECCGDYYDIEVFVNEMLVAEYGDYYHDKGEEKVEGFLDALELIYGDNLKVEKQNCADRE